VSCLIIKPWNDHTK